MKQDGRKHRKSSARPTKSGKKSPRQSEQWKRLWADPVRRAQLIEHNRRIAADRSRRTRFGIPDGMRKEEAERVNAAASERARLLVSKMKDKGVIDQDIDPRAEKALEAAVEVLEGPQNQQTKLAAARLLLDFLKSKPTSKQEVTVNTAEAWLQAISQDTNDEPEAPSDA